MKTLSIFATLVVTAFAIYAADGQPPLPQGSQVGRFQLCQGTSPRASAAGLPTLYRIDTATGQTWSLDAAPMIQADGKPPPSVVVWLPVCEEGDTLHKAAQQTWGINR
jgi:hypothetical protein